MQTEDLIKSLAQEMQAVNKTRSPLYIFTHWLFSSTLYILALVAFSGMRSDFFAKLSNSVFLSEIASLLLIIATSSYACALLAFPDMYQKKRVLLLPSLASLAFIISIVGAYLMDNPSAPRPPHAIECLVCITLYSLLPAAFIFWSIRKYASTHYYKAGILAVITAFSIGALALRIAEPTDSILHVIQWHYLPMIIMACVGAFFGKVFLKW